MVILENELFLVSALGPDEAPSYGKKLLDWSLKDLQLPKDVESHRPLADAISHVFMKMNIMRAWAPSVASANAVIIDSKNLLYGIFLKGHRILYRNPNVPADGTFLEQGETFVMSAAGCPLIIATAGKEMIVAHAGIHSLVDQAMYTDKMPRRHQSVVYAIIEAFMRCVDNLDPEDIKMWVLFSIPTQSFIYHFGNSQYGKRNRQFINILKRDYPTCIFEKKRDHYARIDLEKIIMVQASKKGVKKIFISDSLSKHPELTHTRKGTDHRKRNLLIVKRK